VFLLFERAESGCNLSAPGIGLGLDEEIGFLNAPVLTDAEHDRFFAPAADGHGVGCRPVEGEPCAVIADVYCVPPHVGRGGWSWYTGSAGWMQRAGVKAILGLRIRGALLHVDPCIPRDWPGFEATVVWHSARYRVVVGNPDKVCRGVGSIRLDGADLAAGTVPLLDDGSAHLAEVTLDGKAGP